MTTLVVNEGKEWLSTQVAPGQTDVNLFKVAVGTGSTAVSESDTSLDNEIYRADDSDTNCDISLTSNTGEVKCSITVTGGTEVPAGTTLTEFGTFTDNDDLFHREVRSGVTLESGDKKTFEFTINVENK